MTDSSKEAEAAAQAAADEAAMDRRIARGMQWAQWLSTLATLVVVAGALLLAWPQIDPAGTLKPDVAGSYLSGVVALLALIWLVAGFHLQRLELEAQRHALRRQANETHDLVEQAKDQANAAKDMLAIERSRVLQALEPHFLLEKRPDSIVVRVAGARAYAIEFDWEEVAVVPPESRYLPSLDPSDEPFRIRVHQWTGGTSAKISYTDMVDRMHDATIWLSEGRFIVYEPPPFARREPPTDQEEPTPPT